MRNKLQRNNSIDLLRVIASVAVIFIHVSTAPVSSTSVAVSGKILNNMELIHILMQWSVPVFFMITGFCMMQKESCTYSYCFSKILKYIKTLFTVGLFYALLEGFYSERTINLKVIMNSFKSVIGGYTWEHMWFVYSIIGIYLVIPIIHCFMKQESKNTIILTTLLLLFNILIPAISKYFPIGAEFPFDGYLVYVCFGGMVAKCTIDKKWMYLSFIAVITSIFYLYVNAGEQLFVFKHPIVCFMAIGIFLLISQINFNCNKVILEIAKCSWGIYLLHPFFMNIALKVLKIDLLSGALYIKLFTFAIVLFVNNIHIKKNINNKKYILTLRL